MDVDQLSPLSVTQEKTDKKSISDFSLRSSQCSLLTPNSDEFYEICKGHLKVSPRNAILHQKLNGLSEIPSFSFSNSEQLEEVAKKQLEEKRKNKLSLEIQKSEPEVVSKFDTLSPLILFLIPDNHFKLLIPDYEISICKEMFLTKACHESYFGLGRLLAHEGKFGKSLETFEKAISIMPDTVYKLWQVAIKVKIGEQVQPSRPVSFFQRILCCSMVNKKPDMVQELENLPASPEVFWAFLELSLKSLLEIERPQFYATQLKNLDEYYGYLAWGEIYLRQNNSQKAVPLLREIIRKHGSRPEAYVKLWNFYYTVLKDYAQAEDVVTEALLRINPQHYFQFYILFCVYTSKVYFKQRRLNECLTFLYKKFVEHPTYPIFLYYFGRFSTKSEDFKYNGVAISALEESLRLCDDSRHGVLYYWLSKAFIHSRLQTDAYECAIKAINSLEHSHPRKTVELKHWILEVRPHILKIEKIEGLLKLDLSAEHFSLCKRWCEELETFNKPTIDILYAKLLWHADKHEEALQKLYAVSGVSTVKMAAYFTLLKYLQFQDNIQCVKTVAYEMLVKCRNAQVPSSVWLQVNLIYAKVLVKLKKPGKAILLLKSLAKLLSPFPFADIRYTKLLQRAKNIQDLTTAHSKTLESYNAYSYGNYKNSFIETDHKPREFSKKIVQEDEQPMPSHKKFNKRRSNRLVTEKFENYEQKKSTFQMQKTEKLPESPFSQKSPNDFEGILGFSICSNPVFLYKIAKISYRYSINIHDGICAVKDYIELLKYEKNKSKKETQNSKALSLLALMLEKVKE